MKTARLQGRQERALADTKALRNQVTPIVMAPFADLVVYQGCKVPPRVQKAREGSLREVCWVDHGDGRVRHVHGWYQRVRANATTPSQHNASHSRRKDKHGMYLQLDGNIYSSGTGSVWVSCGSQSLAIDIPPRGPTVSATSVCPSEHRRQQRSREPRSSLYSCMYARTASPSAARETARGTGE